MTLLGSILWAEAAEAGEPPLHCYTVGVAPLIVADLFDRMKGSREMGMKAVRVELEGEEAFGESAGACIVDVTTNKGGPSLKYAFRYDGATTRSTIDLVEASIPDLAAIIADFLDPPGKAVRQ